MVTSSPNNLKERPSVKIRFGGRASSCLFSQSIFSSTNSCVARNGYTSSIDHMINFENEVFCSSIVN